MTCTHNDPVAPFAHITRVGTTTATPRASSLADGCNATAASTEAADAGTAVASNALAARTIAEIARTILHLVLVEGRMRPQTDINEGGGKVARGHWPRKIQVPRLEQR
ncbi:hypothetical protein Lesp01_06960 [Lentzea sp. NBRC 102530]|nr:hypothetical protein Lesp01_06960 [Lentzea sp. NBRC 102530]